MLAEVIRDEPDWVEVFRVDRIENGRCVESCLVRRRETEGRMQQKGLVGKF